MNEPSVFAHDSYLIRRKVLKLLGAAFHIYDGMGELIGYCKQKAFKLKEDIRIFTDETCSTELLTIQARQVIDFSAAYDVIDGQSGQSVGMLQRRGFKSMFRDEWIMCDAAGQQIGRILEDSALLALVRRFLTNLIPQKFTVTIGGDEVATYQQNFNPFVSKLNVQIQTDLGQQVDRRLVLAGAILLNAIEGKQQ